MFARIALVVILSSGLLQFALAEDAPAAAGPARVRIGTYDSRAVALAAGRSDASLKHINDLHAKAKAAEAGGDQKRLAEMKAQLESHQRKLHAQVFSNAPIDDVMQQLAGTLPELAREAQVVAIVPAAHWHDPSVEIVDLTDALAKQFQPSDKTLLFISQLRGKPPVVPVWELEKLEEMEKAAH